MLTTAHFRRLWAELHNRAARGAYFGAIDKPDPDIERLWLDRFATRIRCAGCRRHWLEVIAKVPPPFLSTSQPFNRSTYFSWTVRAHNEINHLLGKPILTLRRARLLWNFHP